MSPWNRRVTALCAMAVVLVGWAVPRGTAGQGSAAVQPPAVGDPARDFTLNRIDGKPITLSALAKEGLAWISTDHHLPNLVRSCWARMPA